MKNIKINLLIAIFSLLTFSCSNDENTTNTSVNSPCELISIDEVKNMFAVELPIEMKDVVYTYPTCVYKWEDGKVTVSVSFGGQEITSSMPSEVLIVMVKKANEAMFKQSTSIYKQPQDISNLGTIAVWDSKMSQLTFLSNSYMFHVHVKVSNNDSENKEKAIEVSKHIIRKI